MTTTAERTPGPDDDLIMKVTDVEKYFPIMSKGVIRHHVGDVKAVDGISFNLRRNETLGLVGESGCGKSTTGRALLHLQPATAGSIVFDGHELTTLSQRAMRPLRRDIQIVFQDPYASLDPRMPVNSIVGEAMRIHGLWNKESTERIRVLLGLVGLNPEHGNRFPHEFSGGQRQRIGIARALALEPKVLVLDEPVSALDVSIQAGVINLLEDLKNRLGLAYIFIAHDLSVVRHISDRVAVMYLGKIVEIADTSELFERPAHPYTQSLLSAIPLPDPRRERARERILLTGDVPSPANPPSGCRFRTRCPKFANQLDDSQREQCVNEIPALDDRGMGHDVACHYAEVVDILA
ncbi:MAG: dipeptide/oligopeptide/nickel ABC transporter ATP-binding protein [Pseudonocardiales bacterium]|nr:MAG: dipeptide/oligopeptide/nickel ABC transporter ATP-binding protein [Pseudonocardiales bacterium]